MSETVGKALSWDDELTGEVKDDFRILPEGEYEFTVKSLTRGQHNGSAKIPMCPKVDAQLAVHNDGADVMVKATLYLYNDDNWIYKLLNSFFISLGIAEKGVPFRMDWSKPLGRSGRCKIKINKYTGNDGKEYTNNQVQKFLDPSENQPTQTTSWGNTSW